MVPQEDLSEEAHTGHLHKDFFLLNSFYSFELGDTLVWYRIQKLPKGLCEVSLPTWLPDTVSPEANNALLNLARYDNMHTTQQAGK